MRHFGELLLSLPKCIYFNFTVLPAKRAIRFPFIVSYRVKCIGVNRKTFIVDSEQISTASMRIGFGDSPNGYRDNQRGIIQITNGGSIKIGNDLGVSRGCVIIADNARLTIGNHFRCNYSCNIDCGNSDITIGDDVVLGWHVNIRNDDGHYIVKEGIQESKTKPIIIGNKVWLCANTTVLKGVTLRNGSVVAYGALLTKTIDEENVLYGGVPAKVIQNNIEWKE